MNKLNIHTNKSSDATLWSQIKLGDEEAFSSLFERYYSTLVNYGKTLISVEDKAKDCVQEVFIDIWTYRFKLNEAMMVKAYLLSSVRKRIARNHARDHIFAQIKPVDSLDFLCFGCVKWKIRITPPPSITPPPPLGEKVQAKSYTAPGRCKRGGV